MYSVTSNVMAASYSALAMFIIIAACSSTEVQGFSTRYSVSHNWTSKSDMPTGGRSDMSASTIGDEIVLVGGCVGKQTYQDWGGYACETVTNETIVYSTLTDTYADNVPDAPRTRYRHAAAVSGGNVYVVGGTNNELDAEWNEVCIAEVDVFNSETKTWSTLDASLPAPTTDGAAFILGTTIYYTGGYITPIYDALNATWALDLGNVAAGWKRVADAPTPRGDHAGVALEGAGYTFGGFTHYNEWASPLADLEMYDAAADKWTVMNGMPTIRGDKALAVLHGRMHVIGGETKTEAGESLPLRDVEVYDPESKTWENEGDIPSARFRFTAASHADNIYIFGGQGFLVGEWMEPGSYHDVVPTVEIFSEKLTALDDGDGSDGDGDGDGDTNADEESGNGSAAAVAAAAVSVVAAAAGAAVLAF